MGQVEDAVALGRSALLPVAGTLEQVGSLIILTARTVSAAVAPPYPYGEELIGQFLFALRLCWFPLLISTVALSFGAPGLQAANFLTLIGALDRLGAFFVLAAIRQIAPLVTADLGARKIREEVDALQVLGVDPVKNLVVPRVMALMVLTGLLDIFALVFGISGGIITELLYNQPLGGFGATLFSNASITDLWGSVLMCTTFGAIIAIVCAYKGMSASGAPPESAGQSIRPSSSPLPPWASSTTSSSRPCSPHIPNCRVCAERHGRLAPDPARMA